MSSQQANAGLIRCFLFLVATLLTFLVFWPGLWGPYFFDDYPNIVNNLSVGITDLSFDSLTQAASSGHSGPLGRPISMVSFALNYYFDGQLNTFHMKFTNLIIHLICGAGLFLLSDRLLNFYQRISQPLLTHQHITWMSLSITAAWLLHPFNLSGVLYIVQRMTSLSALFCIWGLVVYVWGRTKLYDGQAGGLRLLLTSLLIFMPLAVFSKESGVLLPLFLLVVELVFFRFNCREKLGGKIVNFLYISTTIFVAAVAVYVSIHPEWILNGYIGRDFSLTERLMTEARVICFYISQIILPNPVQMGLYHDDISVSRGILEPITTLLAIIVIFSLLLIACACIKRAPALAFGLLFFFVGHLLESTVFSLELAFEHRNYLPMYGIVFAMFYYLLHPTYVDTLSIRRGLTLVLIGLFAFLTYSRAQQWSNPFDFATIEATHHPESARSNIAAGSAYQNFITDDPIGMERNYYFARYYYEKSIAVDKNSTMGLVNLISLTFVRNKQVEPDWIKELTLRFEHAPFAAEMTTQLRLIVNCQEKMECNYGLSELSELFNAALRNPTLTGANRASVYLAQSMFMTNILRDNEKGLAALQDMINAAPLVLENRMTLINYLVARKQFLKARQELDVLENMNKQHRYKKEIANYKDIIWKNSQ